MKGILFISHGKLAEGMVDTCKFVMGESIEQLDYCCLEQGESPESYGKRLSDAIQRIDSGEGVVVVADLFGGTPCIQTILKLTDKIELIAGMNFPLALEILTTRMSPDPIDIDCVIEKSRANISNVKKAINTVNSFEDDE